VLACAGSSGGGGELDESQLDTLRVKLAEFSPRAWPAATLRRRGGPAPDFSTTVLRASGNRELQTHLDLVVARTLRVWP